MPSPPVAMQDGLVRPDSALSLLLEGDGLNARPRPQAVKLKLRKSKTAYASGTATATASGSARGRVGSGFEGTLDNRVIRLQEIAQRHEDMISDPQGSLQDEKTERKRGDEEVTNRLSASEQRLEERISEAAAGALTLETWGVALFILGVAFTTYGGLIS